MILPKFISLELHSDDSLKNLPPSQGFSTPKVVQDFVHEHMFGAPSNKHRKSKLCFCENGALL